MTLFRFKLNENSKLIQRLPGDKIYHVFSIKTSDKLHHFSILWRKRAYLFSVTETDILAVTLELVRQN